MHTYMLTVAMVGFLLVTASIKSIPSNSNKF